MNLSEIRDLDFNDLGNSPPAAKLFVLVVVAAAILGAGYWFKIKEQRSDLESLERQETTLRADFVDKAGKAANLADYERQLQEMQEMLQVMRRQLPSRTEMPDLLVDISQAALGAGIETELFEPGSEVLRDFYAERPINIRMIGNYHQFGAFVSDVSALPRVVVVNMREIAPDTARGRTGSNLKMEGQITIYRYLDEHEENQAAGGAR